MEYAVPGSTFYNFFPATFHSFEPKNIPKKYYNIYTLFNSISIGTSQTTKNDENITQPYDSTFIADRFKYSIRREIRVVSGSKDNILYKKFWLQYLQVYICSPLPVNVSQRIKALPLLCRWYRTLKVSPIRKILNWSRVPIINQWLRIINWYQCPYPTAYSLYCQNYSWKSMKISNCRILADWCPTKLPRTTSFNNTNVPYRLFQQAGKPTLISHEICCHQSNT